MKKVLCAVLLLMFMSVSVWALTEEEASKIVGFAVLNGIAEETSKIVGFAVLNSIAEEDSKIVGFVVLKGSQEANSKLVGFAVLCTPTTGVLTGACPIPPPTGSPGAGGLSISVPW
jgi:hypothetical protein